MKTIMTFVLAIAATSVFGAETIKLSPPDKDSGVTVTQALKARHSGRTFSDKEIPLETLSGVL